MDIVLFFRHRKIHKAISKNYQLLSLFLINLLFFLGYPTSSLGAVYPNCAEAKFAFNEAHKNDTIPSDLPPGTPNTIEYDCPGAEPTYPGAGYCRGLQGTSIASPYIPGATVAEKCLWAQTWVARTTYGEYGNVYDGLKNAGLSCGSVGNPIKPESGNKLQVETDFSGGGAFPLSVVRTYNSVWARYDYVAWSIWKLPSSWGKQWMGNYSAKIDYNPLAGTQPNAIVYRPNGRVLYFTQTSLGIFAPDADIQDKLTQITGNGLITGWRYTVAATQNTETYDASGKLLSIKNRYGATQTLTYGSNGLVQSVTDPAGRQLTFSYDTNNRIVAVLTPQGTYRYAYNNNGTLASVTNPDNTKKSYLYENTLLPTYLTGITDETGNRFATYTYEPTLGRATSSEHAGGVGRVSLVYNNDGTTNVTDSLGTTRTYSFQTILGVLKNTGISQPCAVCGGSTKTTSYDAQGNVISRTDFKGNRTDYTYDLTRNLETKRVEGLTASGATTATTRTITTEWHPTLRLPKRIAEPSKITTYVYSGDNSVNCGATNALCSKAGQETTDTNGSLGFNATTTGAARTWSYTYNANGQVLTENGARTDIGDITTYTYYTDTTSTHRVGDLATIINALGHVTTVNSYDTVGRPLTMTDPNGVVTTLTYTLKGKIQQLKRDTFTATYSYDNAGQLSKITLIDGRSYTYAYDAAHRLTSITSLTGEKLTYTLDTEGHKLSETLTDATGIVTNQYRQVFDALGQVSQSIVAIQGADAKTTYAYDDNGNVISETSPLNELTTYSYDGLNNLVQSQATVNANTLTTQYGYNAQNINTVVKAPNNATTTFTTNAFGERLSAVSPDSGTTVYAYDYVSNLIMKRDARNITLNYRYDPLNRLTQITSPTAAENVTYTYDANTTLTTCTNGKGRLCKVVDQSGTTAFAYDALGHITTRVTQIGGITYTTTFSYTADGHLLSMGLPGGRIIYYSRDSELRLKTVSLTTNGATTSIAYALTYRPDNQLKALTFGNGITVSNTFDSSGHQTLITRSAGNPNESFNWNLNGSLTLRGLYSDARKYQYDTLQRLTSEGTASAVTQSFTYDANGNRLTNGTNAYTYLANSNRMATRKGVAITRDAAGNHTNNGLGQTYAWDTQGHYVQFSLNGVQKATYLYNYQHQRVQKTLWNGTTNLGATVYHYDLAGRLLAETNTAGTVQAVYLYDDNGTPLAIVQAANSAYNSTSQDKRVYLQTDHLGTPRLATDAAKRTVWKWESDAFGSTAPVQDPDGDGIATTINLRFAGQYYDAESGLHDNWHRTYDPSLGRYISSDPIGLNGGMNTFGYVGQSPMVNVDPNGQFFFIPVLLGGFGGEALAGGFIGSALGGLGAYAVFHDNSTTQSDAATKTTCEDEDKCGPLTRVQAYVEAQRIAQVPKKERIYKPFSDINDTSRLDNCSKLQSNGATYAGYYCGWNPLNRIEDHPDGHPHLPGESHHDCPHLHVYGADGETLAIITYKRS